MIIPIEFDIHNQSVHIGETVFPFVPVDSLHPGAVRIGMEDDTAVLRPLTFGERYEISMRAAMTGDPVEALCRWMLQASTLEHAGSLDQLVLETMALIVSGGNEETPPYMESLQLLGNHAGWSIDHIENASSTFVDRILTDLTPKQNEGWTRVLFGNQATKESVSIPEARIKLAENLLRRLDPGFTGEPEHQQTAALPGSSPEISSSTPAGPDSVLQSPPRDSKGVSIDALAAKQVGQMKANTLSNPAHEGFASPSPNEKPAQGHGPIVRHRNHLPLTSSSPLAPTAHNPSAPGPGASRSKAHSVHQNHTDSGRIGNRVPLFETTTEYPNTQEAVIPRYKTHRHFGAQDLQGKEGLLFPKADAQRQAASSPSLETVFQSTFFHAPHDLPQPAAVSRPPGPGSMVNNGYEEDPFRIAQQLALLLDQEADLRGIDR